MEIKINYEVEKVHLGIGCRDSPCLLCCWA